MKEKKVAFFLPSLVGGGAERVMLDLACHFDKEGISVDLILVRAVGPYLAKVPAGIRIFDFECNRVLTCIPSLVRYIIREKPSAVISTLGHANLVAVLAKMILFSNVRIVLREATMPSHPIYDKGSPLKSRFLRLLRKILYPYANMIVAVSKGVSSDLIESFGVPKDRVKVIYNPAVHSELFELAKIPVSHPWFNPKSLPIVLAVGRLSKEKDYATLVKAFSLTCKKRKARLVILGEGEDRKGLQSLIARLGMEDFISLPGFVDNPFAFMEKADVFVLSSVCEGMPNALIQALVLGVAVVSTDCPSGPREVLDGGQLGTLVPVGDVEALAAAIANNLEKPFVPNDLSWVWDNFSLDKVARLYRNALLGDDIA